MEDIGDVKGEINDLNERLLVAQDILKRVEIRAPRSGIVQESAFTPLVVLLGLETFYRK